MNSIDEYDEQLLENITKLKKEVVEGEKLAQDMMLNYGTKEKVIEKAIKDGRLSGEPVHWEYGSSRSILDLRNWLETMHSEYQPFPFRIHISRYSPLNLYMVFNSRSYILTDKALTLKESEVLSRFEDEILDINNVGNRAHVNDWYPTTKFMGFMGNLILKYDMGDLLSHVKEDDKIAMAGWWESIRQQIVHKCNIPRLEYFIAQAHLPEVEIDSVIANRDINGLVEALDYSIHNYSVIQALVEIGEPAVQPLLLALKDTRLNLKEAAIKTLGRIADPVSIEPLVQLLRDDNLCITAELALIDIGKPAVSFLISALNDNNNNVREKSVQILGQIKEPSAIEPLVQLLKDDAVEITLDRSLGEFGELVVPYLINTINSESSTVRKRTASILGQIKDSRATLPLCRMFKSKLKDDRISALEALREIHDPASTVYVIDTIKDKDENIRRLSVEVLGSTGDIRALMPLLKLLKKDKDFRLDICKAITDILGGNLIKGSEETVGNAVGELITLLGDDYLWSYALSILARIKFSITDVLIEVLQNTNNGRIRKRIPTVLASRSKRENEHYSTILNILCEALQDRDKEVKISAAFALGELKDPKSQTPLTKALNDGEVRFAAESTLKEIQQGGK